MAVQELTQPILNPIVAFDATVEHTISFVVIGGAQVLGNRLVISNNQTGAIVYNQMQTTMRLEHIIPANTLENGGYYNAVVYTIGSGGEESVPSTAVPFYCYSRPTLTINNIPATETIENGTYTFTASYSQAENELLDGYQFTLYDSNRNVLSQSDLIYYQSDSSLSYTFVGMSNDTAYYIGITGETVNGTQITSGLVYFTVRYSQPASFAICDLVNDCENGYIQISSNIVAIDGKSNPDPPIYIDDKEVDLREPGSWVEWDEGFDIQNDFTMRAWGRDFNEYENIITLMNEEDTESNPNRIELKWMVGDVLKNLPEYNSVNGYNININDAQSTNIKNLTIAGSSVQQVNEGTQIATGNGFVSFDTPVQKNVNIQIQGTQEQDTREGYSLIDFSSIGNGNLEGVSYSVENDIITLNGNYNVNYPQPINNIVNNVPKINSNFRFQIYPISGSCENTRIGIRFNYANGEQIDYIQGVVNSNNYVTKAMDLTELNTVGFFIAGRNDATFDNYKFKLMFIEGTEEKPYEQYGASPSPDYPSPIKCLGSNKNLYNEETTEMNKYLDGDTGTIGNSTVSKVSDYIELTGKEYTINYTNDTNTRGYSFYDEDKTYISGKDNNKAPYTITKPENAKYIRIGFPINSLDIKVEEGTEATSYSPFRTRVY